MVQNAVLVPQFYFIGIKQMDLRKLRKAHEAVQFTTKP